MSENNTSLEAKAQEFLKRQHAAGGTPPAPEAQAHDTPTSLGDHLQPNAINQPGMAVTPQVETPMGPPPKGASSDVEYEAVPRPLTEEEMAARMAAMAQQAPPAQIPGQMSWPVSTDANGDLIRKETPPVAVAAPQPPQQYAHPHTIICEHEDTPLPPKIDDFEEEVVLTSGAVPAQSKIDDLSEETIVLGEEALAALNGVNEQTRTSFIQATVPDIAAYKKDLIVNQGFTPDEALKASRTRATKLALEELKKYQEEHPNGVIVTIDKEAEKDVSFTPEEQVKIQNARAIKLVVVESKELETLKVLPSTKKVEMSQIRSICGSLAQYSVPMLSLGDYMTFRGAQSGFLASCCVSEDDTMLDAIEKKASILYSCFDGGVLTSRYKKDKPDETLSYEDFCNIFHYEDMDLGIYAVVTASAMEETESTYQCLNQRCQHLYPIHYNQKALLDLSGIPQVFKDRVNAIDNNRANLEGMRAIHEEAIQSVRLKSPITNNVYELGSDTIAEVRKVIAPNMRLINASTAVDLVLLLYCRKLWIWDGSQGGYLPPIDVIEDPVLAFNTICTIHQADVELLSGYLHDNRYTPKFRIKTTCPRCGREEIDDLDVDDMVFLHARGTLTEIHR